MSQEEKRKNIRERLAALRARMEERGADACLIVTEDFHGSEYVGDHFKAREYFSGFTGSAGTLIVLRKEAALFTDGRYFLQAEEELSGSGICLMKSGIPGVPSPAEYLCRALPDGASVFFDGRTVSLHMLTSLRRTTEGHGFKFIGKYDLAGEAFPDRPPLSARPIWELPVAYAGESRVEKIRRVRRAMEECGADYLLLSSLDEIAWLLNLRGDDVTCTPVFLAFLLLDTDGATLCLQEKALPDGLREELSACGISFAPYEEIYRLLGQLPGGCVLRYDGKTANSQLTDAVPAEVRTLDKESPVCRMKAVKNAVEQENLRAAHRADGAALTRFLFWLKDHAGKPGITELSACRKCEEFRRRNADYLGPSFSPIIAHGEHAAIIHYEPTDASDIPIPARGLCLTDTGAHYSGGTTDVSRTVALGPLTEEERRIFTTVLRGHLALAAARFPAGVSGENLDILARAPLWAEGLDYLHGTGHGVGYLLSVHEGPQAIRWRHTGNPCALEAGMIVSDEPGYYRAGAFGIRHENLLLVTPAGESEYGHFLAFSPLTLVPFDRDAIDPALLPGEDRSRLNAYHRQVFAALAPLFSGEELERLRDATAPL